MQLTAFSRKAAGVRRWPLSFDTQSSSLDGYDFRSFYAALRWHHAFDGTEQFEPKPVTVAASFATALFLTVQAIPPRSLSPKLGRVAAIQNCLAAIRYSCLKSPSAVSNFNLGLESGAVVPTASENDWDNRSTIRTATLKFRLDKALGWQLEL